MVNESDACPVERGQDIESAFATLEYFVDDVAEGASDHPPDIRELLKWSIAVLWMTSGEQGSKSVPQLFKVLNSDKGVSFNKIAEQVPAFIDRVRPLIESRTDIELALRTRDMTPLTDEELPF